MMAFYRTLLSFTALLAFVSVSAAPICRNEDEQYICGLYCVPCASGLDEEVVIEKAKQHVESELVRKNLQPLDDDPDSMIGEVMSALLPMIASELCESSETDIPKQERPMAAIHPIEDDDIFEEIEQVSDYQDHEEKPIDDMISSLIPALISEGYIQSDTSPRVDIIPKRISRTRRPTRRPARRPIRRPTRRPTHRSSRKRTPKCSCCDIKAINCHADGIRRTPDGFQFSWVAE